MAVDLADYVGALKREVIPLGSTLFASVTDTQWLAYLADAFWEARFDGFMLGYEADEDGLVEPVSGDSDLDLKYVALIVLYAGIKILRNQILNTRTSFRAKAGPVEFEQQNSATMLAEMLKQLRAIKERALEELNASATEVMVLDAFSVRMFSSSSYYGAPELMG